MTFPPELPWDRLREAAPLSTWQAAARQILAAEGLPDGEPQLYPTGSDVVMRVGEIVVKLSAPQWAEELEAEARLLALVAGRLPVRSPRLLATGARAGWPYVVMTRVPGEALASVWPALDRAGRLALVDEIAALMRALAALPVLEADAARWPAFLAQNRQDATTRLSAARRPPPEAWIPQIEPFLRDTPLSDRPLVWMHTELLGEHLLVEEQGGRWRLAAVIDFADGRVGHPFYEIPALVEFLFQGEPGLLPALLRGLGLAEAELGPALARELCAWGLLHRFGDVARALDAAGAPTPDSFAALAERLYGR